MPDTPNTTTGFVFFILNRNRGLVRIGYGANPREAIRKLQTANPEPLVLTLVIPGNRHTERAIMNRFAGCHTKDGWYDAGRMSGVLFG
jgi:hypothetical protein